MAKNIPFDPAARGLPLYETAEERRKRLLSWEQPGVTPLRSADDAFYVRSKLAPRVEIMPSQTPIKDGFLKQETTPSGPKPPKG